MTGPFIPPMMPGPLPVGPVIPPTFPGMPGAPVPPYLSGPFPVPIPPRPVVQPTRVRSGSVTIGTVKPAPIGWTYELANGYHAQQGYVSPAGRFFADPGDEWRYISHIDQRNRDHITVEYGRAGYWWCEATYEMVPVVEAGSGRPPFADDEGVDLLDKAKQAGDTATVAQIQSTATEFAEQPNRYLVQEQDEAQRQREIAQHEADVWESHHRYDPIVTTDSDGKSLVTFPGQPQLDVSLPSAVALSPKQSSSASAVGILTAMATAALLLL